MPFTDLIIWYLAIYGMAWTIVYSYPLTFVRKYIFEKEVEKQTFVWKTLCKLITCIVCTSFWCSALFVHHYFKPELFLTKVLIVFSNVAFTWFMANKFGDTDDF